MFAKQVAAMKRAEIKSSVLNSASVITCKKKKINYLCFQMHHFVLLSFGFTLLLEDVMCLHMERSFSTLGLILLDSHHSTRHLLGILGMICDKQK